MLNKDYGNIRVFAGSKRKSDPSGNIVYMRWLLEGGGEDGKDAGIIRPHGP